jgi:hypothetical protein
VSRIELEKALMKYGNVSQLLGNDKLAQSGLAATLEKDLSDASAVHSDAKDELRKILISISLSLQISPVKPVRKTEANKREKNAETHIEEVHLFNFNL